MRKAILKILPVICFLLVLQVQVQANTFVEPITINLTEGNDLDDKISTYPNPVSENLYITHTLENFKNISVKIYDALGNVVMKKRWDYTAPSKLSIDMSELDNGVYMMRITVDEEILSKRLVVNHG